MRKTLLALLVAAIALPAQMVADEGMWLLQLMRSQNLEKPMRELGLELTADDIYAPGSASLKDAIGIFGGGCTGEIVSPNGLILTNHHCGYSYIQQLSAVEHNYLRDGFWSQSYEEELPCKDINFTFVSEIKDVTDDINKRIADGTLSEQDSFSERALALIAAEMFEEDSIDGKKYLTPQLLPYFEGNKYYLVYYKKYTDVRLVGTPPNSIGKFGGETDNWMWPRHTGDFSVFRVYGDSLGNPAAYSEKNIPLSTPKYLNISLAGIDYDDFAMIMGFPGSTSRYLTGEEVKHRMYSQNEPRIAMRDAALKIIREEMEKDEAVNIQYASKMARISNYWKNSIGMNKAIVDNKVVETKLEKEAAFKAFAQKVGNKSYETVVEEINAAIHTQSRSEYLATLVVELISNIEFVRRNLAYGNDSTADARFLEKPEAVNSYYSWVHDRDYNHRIDCRVAKALIPLYMSLTTEEERPALLNEMNKKYKGNMEKYIDDVYESSIMASEKNVQKFLKKPTAKKLQKDMAVQLRNAIYGKYREIMNSQKEFNNTINGLHKTYLKGLMEMAGEAPMAPDANFTMRLTYGSVKAYQPKDGVTYNHYTTLNGVMEKEENTSSEFTVPARLKELYLTKDYGDYALPNGDLPVAFLTTNDITGGNSGSPVMNSRGELIGLAFDGNWESLSSDINFNKELQRCINVDIRYVLFIIEKYGNCKRLIDEMNIVR